MSTLSSFGRLPKVSSRKEYMDYLEGIMYAEMTEEEEELEVERRGKPPELKSYLVESNGLLQSTIQSSELHGQIEDTGVSDIKILNLSSGSHSAGFYLDLKDKRFLVLHTGDLAEDTHRLIKELTYSPEYLLDRAWIPTHMLQDISKLPGNQFNGFGLQYLDVFAPTEESDELDITASGNIADRALTAVMSESALRRSLSYTKTRIRRGTPLNYAKDDLMWDGTLSVRSGKSIDDHIALVEETRTRYKDLVEGIEKYRLTAKEVEGTRHLGGRAFNLTFDRTIDDLESFLDRLLNPGSAFRLWGIKSKIDANYYQVLALDLHTDGQMDLEISTNLMRVYLPAAACGNSLLRLFVNLQRYFDSRTRCEEIFS